MTIILNFLSGQLLISISLSFFPEVCLALSLGRYSFVSSLCLTLCLCLYILGISAIFPGLERVALCRSCPMGSNCSIPLVTTARCSKSISCVGCVHPPIVVGS